MIETRAGSGMTEHLSSEVVERFHQQALTPGDKRKIYSHIIVCDLCRERIVTPSVEQTALQSLTEQLMPEAHEEAYHLPFHLIAGYVEQTLDQIDRATAEMHLEDCAECAAEVTDLRDSLATMRALDQSEKT